jgi:hypothetical protein
VSSRSKVTPRSCTTEEKVKRGRLDYCCSLYVGLPVGRLECLDRILRSAARLIGHIPEFDHVFGYMRDVLHWLPSEQRIVYRIAALVWNYLLGLAPAYLRDLCCPVLTAKGSRPLRSSEQGLLHVPFARTSTRQNRAFSVVGRLVWNGLPLELRLLPRTFSSMFFSHLKSVLFVRAGVGSASE